MFVMIILIIIWAFTVALQPDSNKTDTMIT